MTDNEIEGIEMYIYEELLCDYCKERYRGKFYVKLDGVICCVDCKSREKVDRIKVRDVDTSNERVIEEVVKDLTKKDLKMFYENNVEEGRDITYFLKGELGEIDPRKLYFQGNDIDIVLKAHQAAKISMKYNDIGDSKYIKTADKVIKIYLSMREKFFKEEDKEELKTLLESEEMDNIRVIVDSL